MTVCAAWLDSYGGHILADRLVTGTETHTYEDHKVFKLGPRAAIGLAGECAACDLVLDLFPTYHRRSPSRADLVRKVIKVDWEEVGSAEWLLVTPTAVFHGANAEVATVARTEVAFCGAGAHYAAGHLEAQRRLDPDSELVTMIARALVACFRVPTLGVGAGLDGLDVLHTPTLRRKTSRR